MSFWSQLNKSSNPPPDPSEGYETDPNDVVEDEPPPSTVLSPKGPPPTLNVFQHHSSPPHANSPPPRHRGRPLDPVFKAAQGTFPKLATPITAPNPGVHIFVPSVASETSNAEAPETSPEAATKIASDSAAREPEKSKEEPSSEKDKPRVSEKPKIKPPPPKMPPATPVAEPTPPPSIHRSTRRGPPPPPPPPPPRPKETPPVSKKNSPAGATMNAPEKKDTAPPPVGQEESSDDSSSSAERPEDDDGEQRPKPPAPEQQTPLVISTPMVKTTISGVSSLSTSKRLFLETPPAAVRPSPKFVFLSDQKAVPTDLKRLQQTTIKRRRDTISRMHDLDCQVARLLSLYAEETMDLDVAIRDTLDRSVCHPLEASMERLVMERESSEVRGPAIAELEHRVAALDHDMTRHVHVTLSDAKRDQLDSLQNDVFQEILPSMRMEDIKSDKIEGGVIRRYENVAGIIARQFHQEAAARRASLELVKQKFQRAAQEENARGDDILQTLQELREQVRQERLARQREDRKILDDIIRTTVVMKRALLAAVGGNGE